MKKIIILIIVVVLIVVGFFLFKKTPKDPSFPANLYTATSTTYTLADVAAHSDAKSCWTAINGRVYDLTSWVSQHPGGPSKILSICGIDGSVAFDDQHGGATKQETILATFFIGNLK